MRQYDRGARVARSPRQWFVRCLLAGALAATLAWGLFPPSQAASAPPPPPPTNTTPPTVTGTAQQGQVLTEHNGVWTNAPTSFTYQWEDCAADGTGCAPIAGATNQTYTLAAGDVGHTIVVQETAINAGGPSATPATSDKTAVVTAPPPPPPPTNTTPPTVTGTAQQGQVLTEHNGVWTNAPTSFTYQWEDCTAAGTGCTPIAGATNQTYTLAAGDVGHTIVVQETAINAGGPSATPATSDKTAVVAPPPPTNTSPPTIAGIPQQGQTLVENHGSWTNNPTSFTYQWEDCSAAGTGCTPIAGATGQTYTLAFIDVGHTIVVQESATNGGGTGGPASSPPTAVVAPLPTPSAPLSTSPPTIVGSPAIGQTLAEGHGVWTNSPTSFAYQWEDCSASGASCTAIAGANGQTYTVTAADLGHTIVVLEFAANAGGTGGAASAPTAVVAQNGSGTTVSASPSTPVTNQTVTLIATVVSSSVSAPPSGTVSFNSGGSPIQGCGLVPVNTSAQSATVFCQASFGASASPVALTAVFSPTAGSNLSGSTSAPDQLAVGPDSTSTALDVSNPAVAVGGSAKYTATVTPTHKGAVTPTGAVAFLDGGKTIASCAKQPLKTSAGASAATCSVSYGQAGTHVITARYAGDANFNGSTSSPPQSVTVAKPPPRVQGTIKATMQWSFFFTPTYTTVMSFVVNKAPVGGTIQVKCTGKGCPFKTRSQPITSSCKAKSKLPCKGPLTKIVNLAQMFSGERLRPGQVIIIDLVRANWIGKDYRFTIRGGRGPRVSIACLAPGAASPGVGC